MRATIWLILRVKSKNIEGDRWLDFILSFKSQGGRPPDPDFYMIPIRFLSLHP